MGEVTRTREPVGQTWATTRIPSWGSSQFSTFPCDAGTRVTGVPPVTGTESRSPWPSRKTTWLPSRLKPNHQLPAAGASAVVVPVSMSRIERGPLL